MRLWPAYWTGPFDLSEESRTLRRDNQFASANLSAKESVEHLLKAVELALVDVPAGFDSIPEHSRTCAINQGLPWQAGEYARLTSQLSITCARIGR
jgi:hypothetical protein